MMDILTYLSNRVSHIIVIGIAQGYHTPPNHITKKRKAVDQHLRPRPITKTTRDSLIVTRTCQLHRRLQTYRLSKARLKTHTLLLTVCVKFDGTKYVEVAQYIRQENPTSTIKRIQFDDIRQER